MKILSTSKGLVRKNMKQENGWAIHWWTSGYTELLRKIQVCTTVLAGIHYGEWLHCHWAKTLPCHCVIAPVQTPTSSFLPPAEGFPHAHVSWARSEQVHGAHMWGFFQLSHFIVHSHLWGIGWLLQVPQIVSASPSVEASWEGSHNPVLNVMCWLGTNEWMNGWWEMQVLFNDVGLVSNSCAPPYW